VTRHLHRLEEIEYRQTMLAEPSLMEQAFAIFANVIEFDQRSMPVNAKYAEHRAAKWIRSYCDRGYRVVPPFESWEVELHEPPPREDPKPWPKACAEQE
jgi:hypothetical protein